MQKVQLPQIDIPTQKAQKRGVPRRRKEVWKLRRKEVKGMLGMFAETNITKWWKRNDFTNTAVFARVFGHFEFSAVKKIFNQHDVLVSCLITGNKHYSFIKENLVDFFRVIPCTLIERLDDVDLIVVFIAEDAEKVRFTFKRKFAGVVIYLQSVVLELKDYNINYGLIERLYGLEKSGIQTLVFQMPYARKVVNQSKWEQIVCQIRVSDVIEKDPEKYVPLAGMEKKYIDFLKKRRLYWKGHIQYKDYRVLNDVMSKYVNIVDHIRSAVGIPTYTHHNVHMVGDSNVVGLWSVDEDTCASFLQRRIMKKQGKEALYGCLIYGSAEASLVELQHRLRDVVISSGDLVVVIAKYYKVNTPQFKESCGENGVKYYSSQADFNRPHSMGEVFYDAGHMSPNGNRVIAEILFDKLFVHSVKIFVPQCFRHYFCTARVASSLSKISKFVDVFSPDPGILLYTEFMKSYRITSLTAGCVVMNCNPYTLGHLYLVENVAVQEDRVYVFVVEEDRSYFPFTDRIKLVKVGSLHLPNVVVLPSSRYIISTVTLPEYFIKGENPDVVVDASVDFDFFCKWIAPVLAVVKRFVGEEPLDRVTLQYNHAMCRRLPACGVEVRIIPRSRFGGRLISASRVRDFLKKKCCDEIESIVPQTTLAYLKGESYF